jgi:hypothetical protein
MTSINEKIRQIANGFNIPPTFDIYLKQKDLDYSVKFLINLIVNKIKKSPNITKTKLLFVDFINKFMDVANEIPIIDDSSEIIKVICPKTNNTTFSMSKKSLGIDTEDTIPEELKNNKELNNKVYKNVCSLFYTKMLKSDFNNIKYDITNAILNPIYILTNTYLKGMVLTSCHSDNVIDYALNFIVKTYIKQNNMMVCMKGPLFCFFKSILCAVYAPEIIDDKNIIIRTNKYDLYLTKIDKTFISVEYSYLDSKNKRWKMPLILHEEDDSYRKFLPSFLLMFSKYWNLVNYF